jgi:hypothetical protein
MTRTVLAAVAAVGVAQAIAFAQSGEPPSAAGDLRHIRSDNTRIEEAFRFAQDRSPAFRAVIDVLDASNCYVYLVEGACGMDGVRSCLRLIGAVPHARYVQIRIDSRQSLRAVVAQLAHELHHATEIADRPDVVDVQTLRAAYQQIGYEGCGPRPRECWETAGARRTERTVVEETTSFRSVAAMKP